MTVKNVIQIEQLEASYLIEKLEGLEKQIRELQNQNKPAPQNNSDFISRKEVAEIFKISIVTAHEWSSKGILRTYKIGNRIFYKRSEIENALTEITNRKTANR
jgi:hypothetical protein